MNGIIDKQIDIRLKQFAPASLDDLNRLMLMNRFDTKLPANASILPDILSALASEYKILEIDNHRIFNYSSCYYDTDDYLFYNNHHNGKKNRLKIRNRKYVESGLCYIEIKKKCCHSIIDKSRLSVGWHDCENLCNASEFLYHETHLDAALLKRKLLVEYQRITLLNEQKKEKITIDLDITFKTNNTECRLEGLTMIELKQKSFNRHNSAQDILRQLNVRPADGFSKYCIGLVCTGQDVKYNRFKSQILSLHKITGN